MSTTPKTRQDDRSGSWLGILVRTLVVVVVLLGAYLGLAAWSGGHIVSGTKVAGVDVGGQSEDDAVEHITTQLDRTLTAPVSVKAGSQTLTLDPGQAGLAADVPASVKGLTKFTMDPGKIMEALTGHGSDHDLVVRVDEQRLRAALEQQASKVDTAAADGSVRFEGAKIVKVDSKAGSALDVDGAVAAVKRAWPRSHDVSAPLREVQPKVPQGEVDRFTNEVAKQVLAPVTVVAGERHSEISTEKVARLLSTRTTDDGHIELVVDEKAAAKYVRAALSGIEKDAQDAKVAMNGSAITVVPAAEGTKLNLDGAGAAFTKALTDPSRTVTVELTKVEPKVTTEQAKSWNFDSMISEFHVKYPTDPGHKDRTENLRIGLSKLNGILVAPGEQFSLEKAFGPLTVEAGWKDAGVIKDGVPGKSIGGGLSQVSTTLYNATFLAGVQLDEHKPHSYYISRYPEGREATFWGGQIDNKWTNDTGAPILIKAFITPQETVVQLYGHRRYTVAFTSTGRMNIKPPATVVNTRPDCTPGDVMAGFDIIITRNLFENGTLVRSEKIPTTYAPSNRIKCVRKK